MAQAFLGVAFFRRAAPLAPATENYELTAPSAIPEVFRIGIRIAQIVVDENR
jgi:hypothetical protein